MKIKVAGLSNSFLCQPFQREVEECLAAVDSCGHPVCIQIFPGENPDNVVLMLRKEDGGEFSDSPQYGQFTLPRSAYEGDVASQQEAQQTIHAFITAIKKVLSGHKS
ncbi:MAG: hypothetical protein AB7E95_11130 [Kiritimatiellales bacterium]